MIFKDRESFNAYLLDKFNGVEEDLIAVIRAGYSFKELIKAPFKLEVIFVTSTLDGLELNFFGSSFDDQQYFEVYDCYSESELLYKLQHTPHKDGLEDYTE